MNEVKKELKTRSRGIYLLPNLFTVAALFAGFYSIVSAIKGLFDTAAIAIFVAILLDGLDGRVARLTQTQTEFGAQMDSMSDMVCFGVTPALVLYEWCLSGLGKFGWLAAFIYTVCTALRLARFNTLDDDTDKRYFRGLATPASAGLVASIIWTCTQFHIDPHGFCIVVAIIAICLGLLKVSTIPYRSFKDFDARNKIPFLAVVVIVLVFAFIALDPPDVFLAFFVLYVLSGPVGVLWRYIRRNKKKG